MSEQPPDLAHMRVSYARDGIDVSDLEPTWHEQFQRWLADAVAHEITEPNAMVLATASADGVPASRTVLAKAVDASGVTFFTNYTSAKSADLLANPRASVTFPWYPLQRQIHVRGRVEQVPREISEEYWATRWRGSQIGAWASPQSTVVNGRAELEEAADRFEAEYPEPDPVPLPPFWGGWRIVPETVEFWQGRLGRLHDRLVFRRVEGDRWIVERRAP